MLTSYMRWAIMTAAAEKEHFEMAREFKQKLLADYDQGKEITSDAKRKMHAYGNVMDVRQGWSDGTYRNTTEVIEIGGRYFELAFAVHSNENCNEYPDQPREVRAVEREKVIVVTEWVPVAREERA